MARATTKADLISSANGQFEKMWMLIDSMSEELQDAPFAEAMATAGKEAHWAETRTYATCSCICTSGISYCCVG